MGGDEDEDEGGVDEWWMMNDEWWMMNDEQVLQWDRVLKVVLCIYKDFLVNYQN